METRTVVEYRDSVQYDGTNGREIAIELFEADPDSVTDDGTTLTFTHPNGVVHQVPSGSHILFVDNRGINDGRCDWKGSYPDAAFNRKFRTEATRSAEIARLADRIAALENSRPTRT